MIVADTNLIAYLLIPGLQSALAREVLRRDPHWTAPPLWKSELRNVLALYVRRLSLPLSDALEFMAEAETLLGGGGREVSSAPVLRLAQQSRCSAYDCEFVALAQQLGVPLVTSDAKVLRAFPQLTASPDHFTSTPTR